MVLVKLLADGTHQVPTSIHRFNSTSWPRWYAACSAATRISRKRVWPSPHGNGTREEEVNLSHASLSNPRRPRPLFAAKWGRSRWGWPAKPALHVEKRSDGGRRFRGWHRVPSDRQGRLLRPNRHRRRLS